MKRSTKAPFHRQLKFNFLLEKIRIRKTTKRRRRNGKGKTEKKNLLLCIFPLPRPNLSFHLLNTAWSRSAEKKDSEFCLSCHFGFVPSTFLCEVGVFSSARLTLMNPRWLPNKTLQASLIRSVILLGWMGKWRQRENVAIMGKKYSTRERGKWWIDFSKLNN